MAERVQQVKGPGARPPRGVKPQVKNPMKIFTRIMKYALKDYTVHCIAVVIAIFVNVLANVQGTMFMKTLIDGYITPMLTQPDPDFGPLLHAILRVAGFYGIGIVAAFIQNRTMIYVSQGTLRNLRNDLFGNMEKLPIKYFDTHAHGDIMSIYTNDIDTLRQMISQSIPQIINSAITIVSVFVSMLILNIPLTITTLVMVSIMLGVTKKVAGFSGNFFVKQQRDLGKVNGFIEEMMDGQKVVKVFCHEEENIEKEEPDMTEVYTGYYDLTHNGYKEKVVTKVYLEEENEDFTEALHKAGNWGTVEVYEYLGDGQYGIIPLWSQEFAIAHAGNVQIFLTQKDGYDYLVVTSFWTGQGVCYYDYNVLSPVDYSFDRYHNELNGADHYDPQFFTGLESWLKEDSLLLAATDIDMPQGQEVILTTNEETHYAEEYLKVKKERLQSVEDID